MGAYGAGNAMVFPAQFAEVEPWFEEWILGIKPKSRRTTPNRKWGAFVMWEGAWRRLPIDLAKATGGG